MKTLSVLLLVFLVGCSTVIPPVGYVNYCQRYPDNKECGGDK